MSTSCSKCRVDCTLIAVITSLILGIITAFLRITGEITLTSAFLWVLLGIAVLFLAVTMITAAAFRQDGCDNMCSSLTALLVGILGTILFSVILLAIDFATTSTAGAIFSGSLLFFFFLTLTSAACFSRCLLNCNA